MLPIAGEDTTGRGRLTGEPLVEQTASLIMWQALTGAVYALPGFNQLADDAFRALVLGRILEPTSKADTVRGAGQSSACQARLGDIHAVPQGRDRAGLPHRDRESLPRAGDPEREWLWCCTN
jgi:hypothetical protein